MTVVAKRIFGLALAAATCSATGAWAQGAVYRCLDENGRPQYTNVRTDTEGKKCTLVTREVSVVPGGGAPSGASAPRPAGAPPTAAAPPGGSPSGFPRVDPNTQRARDDSRRKILDDELAAERRSLEKAKADLTEQQSIRNGDERNYQRVLDRLKPYQDAVERHERNVGAIEKEIGNLR